MYRLALTLFLLVMLPACSSVREAYGEQRDVSAHALSFRDAYGATTGMPLYAPPMDSNRKIATQDCSKPVTLDQGNLRCR